MTIQLPTPRPVYARTGGVSPMAFPQWEVAGYGLRVVACSRPSALSQFVDKAVSEGVFYRTCGRLFLVTNSFMDDAEANIYMVDNPREAVIGVDDAKVYLADIEDSGTPDPTARKVA